VGTVFDVKGMVSGTEEIIACAAPHQVVLKGGDMGKLVPTDIRTIEPVDGGVRFTRHVDLDAGGFMGWMTRRMLGMVSRRNDRFVENLKQVLERG
jgi:carbon monoxide dehydrogenase subunit G